jgi:hypothetical protein
MRLPQRLGSGRGAKASADARGESRESAAGSGVRSNVCDCTEIGEIIVAYIRNKLIVKLFDILLIFVMFKD